MKLKHFYKISLKFVCFLMVIIVCSFSLAREIQAEQIEIAPNFTTESLRVCEYNYITNTETEYDITIRVAEIQSDVLPSVSENLLSSPGIIPPDTSSLIDPDNYSSYPYSAICRVVCNTVDGIGSGTAFLVKNRIALTSAHCIFKSGWSTNTHLMAHPPASAETSHIFNNGSRVIKAIIPKEYKTSTSSNYDWAILVVEDNLGVANGTFSLSITTPSVNQDAYMYGYDNNYNMRFSPGYYTAVYTHTVRYTCDTTNGMSGSPVVYMVNTNGTITYPVYAIHSLANPAANNLYNQGVRINRFITERVSSLNTQYS